MAPARRGDAGVAAPHVRAVPRHRRRAVGPLKEKVARIAEGTPTDGDRPAAGRPAAVLVRIRVRLRVALVVLPAPAAVTRARAGVRHGRVDGVPKTPVPGHAAVTVALDRVVPAQVLRAVAHPGRVVRVPGPRATARGALGSAAVAAGARTTVAQEARVRRVRATEPDPVPVTVRRGRVAPRATRRGDAPRRVGPRVAGGPIAAVDASTRGRRGRRSPAASGPSAPRSRRCPRTSPGTSWTARCAGSWGRCRGTTL